jgi:pimeloyl-ACP methyl ester carboxylesterase
MNMREDYYFGRTKSGPHQIYYSDWGPLNGQPLICVHGLTGNGFDFDYLAQDLIQHGYRVIGVDLPGRGRSDFLQDPMDYNYDQYVQDLNGLLDHLKMNEPGRVDWLGVSLGGLLGMRIAGVIGTPIRRIIINDVGPTVAKPALDFIYNVISQKYTFDTVKDLELRMRATRGLTWGPVTDEQWKHMAEHNARATDEGLITYAYDPNIAHVFKVAPIGDFDLWKSWDAMKVPVLLIQGAMSVLLTNDLIKDMEQSGPDFDLVIFEGCGHVPSLMAPDQIEVIRQWLSIKPI